MKLLKEKEDYFRYSNRPTFRRLNLLEIIPSACREINSTFLAMLKHHGLSKK
jgi:hypothetical protein